MRVSETKRANRILMPVTTMGFTGGAEAQVARLATELKARDWEVCIVTLIPPGESVSGLTEKHIEVYSLDMKRRVPDLRAIFRLRSIVRRFQPDIVHSHMYHANILSRVTRIICPMPVLICSAHSTREASTRGGPTWHKEFLYRITDNVADRTTTICDAGFERYVRVRAVPRHKLRIVPNGVDTDVFKYSEHVRARARKALGLDSQFVWLAVGRMVVHKDYPTLFSAVSMLAEKNFTLLIAGDGPLENDLRRDCASRRLTHKVRFCGVREDVVDLYNAADAFVMSSQVEGMPMALLEAASTGLPAVVTDVGGNAEVVKNEITGFLVPPKNPAELAAALRRVMLATPERRRSMSRAARQLCYERYRIAAIVDKWIDLYEECLQTPAVLEADRVE